MVLLSVAGEAMVDANLIFDKTCDHLPDFEKGVILLVDKPYGWSSFDVVNKIRGTIKYQLGIKKLKVGHAGTLDPLATGLLIVCTGKLTKSIDQLQAIQKSYSGTFMLGKTTPTYDSESIADQDFDIDHINHENIQSTTQKFIGKIQQIPPIYSAIKINGKAAYTLARKGRDIEMKQRDIEIYSFDISRVDMPLVDFVVECSKGTYIRSLAHDFGKALKAGAYLSALRREAIGPFSVKDAFTIEELVQHIAAKAITNLTE